MRHKTVAIDDLQTARFYRVRIAGSVEDLEMTGWFLGFRNLGRGRPLGVEFSVHTACGAYVRSKTFTIWFANEIREIQEVEKAR